MRGEFFRQENIDVVKSFGRERASDRNDWAPQFLYDKPRRAQVASAPVIKNHVIELILESDGCDLAGMTFRVSTVQFDNRVQITMVDDETLKFESPSFEEAVSQLSKELVSKAMAGHTENQQIREFSERLRQQLLASLNPETENVFPEHAELLESIHVSTAYELSQLSHTLDVLEADIPAEELEAWFAAFSEGE